MEGQVLQQFDTQLTQFFDELVQMFPLEGDLVLIRLFLCVQISADDKMTIFTDTINSDNIKNLKKLLYFEVISLTGRKVKTGYTKGIITVSKLNKGIYFIILDNGTHKDILKFIKC